MHTSVFRMIVFTVLLGNALQMSGTCRLAITSHQPPLFLMYNWQTRSVFGSVKLLLAFTGTVIPGSSLLEIQEYNFCSLLCMDYFVIGNPIRRTRSRPSSVGVMSHCTETVDRSYRSVQVIMCSVRFCHFIILTLHKIQKSSFYVDLCTVYAFTYLYTLTLQSVSLTVVDLTAAISKLLMLPNPSSSTSNTSTFRHMW